MHQLLSHYCENTPSLVWVEDRLARTAERLRRTCAKAACKLLYSVKALSHPLALQIINTHVEGFSVCSPFEARLAQETMPTRVPIHITSPCFDVMSFGAQISDRDYVAFNSISQFQHQVSCLTSQPSAGIRINPGRSLVSDNRYDPCRRHSKLGVPLDELNTNWANLAHGNVAVTGLHFHNNCEGSDFSQLLETVLHVSNTCSHILDDVQWINIGGGYLFKPDDALDDFFAAADLLKKQHGLTVFAEPGAAFVREAGYLVSTVVDRFSRDGKEIAILDTTVNHMPEVFEFQYQPDVLGASDAGKYSYLLAGCSCLAGDLFGEYSFEEPLTVGSRVVFANVGDYTTPKWHYFNGINLPSIYSLNENNELTLIKQFTYEDFSSRYGVESNVVV